MLVVSLIFVWRSFYAMRIPREKETLPESKADTRSKEPVAAGH